MLSLATQLEQYTAQAEARETVSRLLGMGTPAAAVQLLIGRRTRDVREQPIGGFAGQVAPDALVGTFAGPGVPRNRTAGDWLGGDRRQGSFGDVERDELVSIDEAGREIARTVDRRALRRLLRAVASDRVQSDRLIAELHEGHALLLLTSASGEVLNPERSHAAAELAA